ncbi:MAG: hypothetical protein RLZZ416_88 [Candidatus Parcubacteria bacterium]
MLLGFAWYHPKVFGGVWMRAINMTPEMVERGKKKMPIMAFLAFLSSMLVAYVMNYFGIAWGVYDSIGAIELGFWCWVGFAAPPMFGMVLWEQKPIRYYAIVAGYWLVAFIVMALVLVIGSQMVGSSTYESADASGQIIQGE